MKDAINENRISRIARRIKADVAIAVDQSVEPVEHDIDIKCYYDSFLSKEEFDENFRKLGDYDYYGCHLLAYGFNPYEYDTDEIFEIADYDALADYFGYEYNYRQYISDIDPNDLAEKILEFVPLEELSSMFLEDFEGKNDFADWIEERTEEEESDDSNIYAWLMYMLPDAAVNSIEEEAKLMVDYPSLDDLWKAAADSFAGGIRLKEGWTSMYTTGYSKGDYATVFAKSEDMAGSDARKDIEHMIWDSPVCCRIEVDGIEYYVEDGLSDRYDYDKDEVIEVMKSQMGDDWDDGIGEYLEENLPDHPAYN